MFGRQFWLGESGVLARCLRTFAQTAAAMIGVSSFSVWSVDWQNVLGVSLGAALLSILMSLDRSTEVAKAAPVPVVTAMCGDEPKRFNR
jgi:hypothetical protein